MQKILDVNWFLKLPKALRELFVSPKVYTELPIGAEGHGSRLILRVPPSEKFFAETLSSPATMSVLFLFHLVPKIDVMCGIFA